MSESKDLVPIPAGATLLRTAKVKKDFPPDSDKPLPRHFEPSSDDKADAASRKLPVLVSVWDRALTTNDQEMAFRTTADQRLGFQFPVEALKSAAPCGRLEAWRDPHPDTSKPGWEGHSGISGLEKRPEDKKDKGKAYFAMLSRLCDACTPA